MDLVSAGIISIKEESTMSNPDAVDIKEESVMPIPEDVDFKEETVTSIAQEVNMRYSRTSVGTAAASFALPVDWEAECMKLRREYEILSKTVKAKQDKINELNGVLGKFFTPGQIQRMKRKKGKVAWTWEDISSAISLRTVSPKAYRYLRTVKRYPLPGLSILRKWIAKLGLTPGILTDVLMIMKEKSLQLRIEERLTVLSFDEMPLSNQSCFEDENILDTHQTVQVVMARSLMSNWKQVIYYDFDRAMSADLLMQIVSELESISYTVVGIVSDFNPPNEVVWKELKVAYDRNCSVPHPSRSGQNIYVFCDAPYLLKSIRNHILDSDLKFEDGIVNRKCLEDLLSQNTDYFTLVKKLTQHHLDVAGAQREGVKMAAECLSHTVAEAINWCGKYGLLKNVDWIVCSRVINLCNYWFDVFNSVNKSNGKSSAFGLDLEKQLSILEDMDKVMTEVKISDRESLLPFQRGILLNNKSLPKLFDEMKRMYNVEYIMTYRLNQDVLKNLFSYLRGLSAENEYPTPIEFKQLLKRYMMEKDTAALFTEYTVSSFCDPSLDSSVCLTECVKNYFINAEKTESGIFGK